MSLEVLAAFAVANNNTPSRKALYELTIEEARARVKISDGNKKKAEDGSVALTLGLGKKKLSLDAISKGATRVNATADQIQQFTSILQAAIDGGSFDEEIIRIQTEAQQTVNFLLFEPTPTAEPAQTEVPSGVDLDELG